MAEGTYEYECMRAELLGLEKPDYDEFVRNKSEQETNEAEEEDQDVENLKEVDYQQEGMKRITGGLEELNSILKKTQVKLNRFKASCGSITGLLKRKDSRSDSVTSLSDNAPSAAPEAEPAPSEYNTSDKVDDETKPRKSDLAKALDADLDRIDSMIEKAENAQYSMAHQSKQMKKFLK